MKTSALTIRLDPDLDEQLSRVAEQSGRSRRRSPETRYAGSLLWLQVEEARRQIMPFAEARRYLTDEDIFRAVS